MIVNCTSADVLNVTGGACECFCTCRANPSKRDVGLVSGAGVCENTCESLRGSHSWYFHSCLPQYKDKDFQRALENARRLIEHGGQMPTLEWH